MPAYERRRFEDHRIPTTVTVTSTDWPGEEIVEEHGFIGHASTMFDTNNRAFKKSMHNGYLTLSDCLLTKFERSYEAGHITGRNHTSGWTANMSGDLMYIPAGAPLETNLMTSIITEQQALIQAFAKVNESQVMTGELLATLGRTVGMLTNPLKAVSRLLDRTISRKGMLLNAKRPFRNTKGQWVNGVYSATQASASAWLQYRYGLNPLLIDIKKTMSRAQNQHRELYGKRLVARVQRKSDISKTDTWEPTSISDFADAGVRKQHLHAVCSAGVFYVYKHAGVSGSGAEFFGLGSRDMFPVIHELIPLSFVADWFTNMGDWLQAMNPNPNITILGWWTTIVDERRTEKSAFVKYFGSLPKTYWEGSFGSEIEKNLIYRRTCNQPLPSTPEFLGKYKLGTLHQVDACALLIQGILGKLAILRH